MPCRAAYVSDLPPLPAACRLLLLHLHHQVLHEAEAVFGEAEGEPSRRAVDDMGWTLSVLKEALRKYSIVPVVTRTLVRARARGAGVGCDFLWRGAAGRLALAGRRRR